MLRLSFPFIYNQIEVTVEDFASYLYSYKSFFTVRCFWKDERKRESFVQKAKFDHSALIETRS